MADSWIFQILKMFGSFLDVDFSDSEDIWQFLGCAFVDLCMNHLKLTGFFFNFLAVFKFLAVASGGDRTTIRSDTISGCSEYLDSLIFSIF